MEKCSEASDLKVNINCSHVRGEYIVFPSDVVSLENTWLETLLNSIDTIPQHMIEDDILTFSIAMSRMTHSINSRRQGSLILHKIASKFSKFSDEYKQKLFVSSIVSLCDDPETDIRLMILEILLNLSKHASDESLYNLILPKLISMSMDDKPQIRLNSLNVMNNILQARDNSMLIDYVFTNMINSSKNNSINAEELIVSGLSVFFGKWCQEISPNARVEKENLLRCYIQFSRLGLEENKQKITSLINIEDLHTRSKYDAALSLPAMNLFFGIQNFEMTIYYVFKNLIHDLDEKVRWAVALSVRPLTSVVGIQNKIMLKDICTLFYDTSPLVLEVMINNLVGVVDDLATSSTSLQFQGGLFNTQLIKAIIHCDTVISQTMNWRLQSECIQKISCLANYASSDDITSLILPLLYQKILSMKPLPCRTAACRTLLIFLKFSKQHGSIHSWIQKYIVDSESCHRRILYIYMCEMAISIFSRKYFKLKFFKNLISFSKDRTVNIRILMSTQLSNLYSIMESPEDDELIRNMEEKIQVMCDHETDKEVLRNIYKHIQDQSGGIPPEKPQNDERKLKEENEIMYINSLQGHKRSNSLPDLHFKTTETKRKSKYMPTHTLQKTRQIPKNNDDKLNKQLTGKNDKGSNQTTVSSALSNVVSVLNTHNIVNITASETSTRKVRPLKSKIGRWSNSPTPSESKEPSSPSILKIMSSTRNLHLNILETIEAEPSAVVQSQKNNTAALPQQPKVHLRRKQQNTSQKTKRNSFSERYNKVSNVSKKLDYSERRKSTNSLDMVNKGCFINSEQTQKKETPRRRSSLLAPGFSKTHLFNGVQHTLSK